MADLALGVRDHSGWAVVVAVAGDVTAPDVVLRERVALLDPDLPRQPYHAAVDLDLPEAATLIEQVERSAEHEAASMLNRVLADLAVTGHRVACIAVAAVTVAVPDSLEMVLSSHALLHAAEGELYREALAEAAAGEGLPVTRFLHKTVMADAAACLGVSGDEVRRTMNALGKDLGPPWQKDHKEATAAALIAAAGR
ncbi:MAG: hypothetical protein WKF43_08535 [Acidimicrobiales bacterium]